MNPTRKLKALESVRILREILGPTASVEDVLRVLHRANSRLTAPDPTQNRSQVS